MYPLITVSPKKIREFGLVIFLVVGVLMPLWILWQNQWVWVPRLWGLTALGLGFAGLCFGAGMRMAPVYLAWMRIAVLLGTIMTALIVSVVFFLLITPIGLVRRLLKRPSDYHAYPQRTQLTYWKDRNDEMLPEQLEKMY